MGLPAVSSSRITTTDKLRLFIRPVFCLPVERGLSAAENRIPRRSVPFHALIIGIDNYRSDQIPNLRGAASDADAVDEYVRTELRVPARQIVNLRDKQATRSAIVRELQALCSRSTRANEPILIYFAGHGTSAPAPDGWATASHRISSIVAHDTLAIDRTGTMICPIPDRTIAALLYKLAQTRTGDLNGDNITVILDCCHSGSGTRDLEHRPYCRRRGFDLRLDFIPPTLDQTIWDNFDGDRAVDIAPGFATSGCRSHVLLAACRESETAFEENGHGVFTRALLSTLRSVATDSITYRELVQRLPIIPGQTPQCEGHNVNRLLFDALAPSRRHIAYLVHERDGKFVMNAGACQGVSYGARFSISKDSPVLSKRPPISTIMVATAVETLSTELSGSIFTHHQSDPSAVYFAWQVSPGDAEVLRLHVPAFGRLPRALRGLFKELGNSEELGCPVLLLSDERQASIGVSMSGSVVTYPIYDPLITSLGLHRLYGTTKADVRFIHAVLRGAAPFFWNLHRSPVKSSMSRKVIVQVHELRVDVGGCLDDDLRPPFIPHGENVLRSGTVNIVADDKTIYGMSLRNSFGVPLHVSVFFFDCSDLSVNYYQPPAIGKSGEASLPADGTLSIGYGADGGVPFKFRLRPGQERDVGFIKVFISTEPVDLSGVLQASVFDTSMPRGTFRAQGRSRHAWDTILIPVVQHKAPSGDL
ncbi:unnamed protein product [Peniophora sp. CBMAI 1063]|nr:unnamed protein product [Peniophora sp. CBMAI 1063]